MTASLATPHGLAAASAAVLRRTAIAFIIAGIVWILGDIFEIVGYATGAAEHPGPLQLVGQVVFAVAIISYAVALISGARRGLAGGSLFGRIGLVVTAVLFLYILIATTLAMLGMTQLTVVLPVVGPLRNVAEVLAGIGILLAGPQRLPARAVYLVYALALFVAMVADTFLPSSGEGPGFLNEIGQALLWIVIGCSVLRATQERRGALWFALAIAGGALVLVGIAVPH